MHLSVLDDFKMLAAHASRSRRCEEVTMAVSNNNNNNNNNNKKAIKLSLIPRLDVSGAPLPSRSRAIIQKMQGLAISITSSVPAPPPPRWASKKLAYTASQDLLSASTSVAHCRFLFDTIRYSMLPQSQLQPAPAFMMRLLPSSCSHGKCQRWLTHTLKRLPHGGSVVGGR